MKRVIITGAGGFVGCELTKKMIENGIQVTAVSLDFNDSFPDSPLITKIKSEIGGTTDLDNVIPNGVYDTFYHLAWQGVNGPNKAKYDVQINNIQMALMCADYANRIGCKKFLCAGTIAERSVDSLSHLSQTNGGMMYAAAKKSCQIILETYCKTIGIESVWMQFSNIFGASNETGNLISYTIKQITNHEEATFGPAEQPYDFIFVDDLIEAVFRLGQCETKGGTYFIGSGSPRILKDYILTVGKIFRQEELIRIGARGDDGIRYSYDMFDTSLIEKTIGDYVSSSFETEIERIYNMYGKE